MGGRFAAPGSTPPFRRCAGGGWPLAPRIPDRKGRCPLPTRVGTMPQLHRGKVSRPRPVRSPTNGPPRGRGGQRIRDGRLARRGCWLARATADPPCRASSARPAEREDLRQRNATTRKCPPPAYLRERTEWLREN